MREIPVSGREEGGTLLKLLGKYLKEAPVSFFYKMLRKKNITLNGKKAQGGEKLVNGDIICLFFSDDTIRQFGGTAWLTGQEEDAFPNKSAKPVFSHTDDGCKAKEHEKNNTEKNNIPNGKMPQKQPEVVYEDNDILLVNKPAGWLTQKAMPEDFSLNEWVAEYLLLSGSMTKQ